MSRSLPLARHTCVKTSRHIQEFECANNPRQLPYSKGTRWTVDGSVLSPVTSSVTTLVSNYYYDRKKSRAVVIPIHRIVFKIVPRSRQVYLLYAYHHLWYQDTWWKKVCTSAILPNEVIPNDSWFCVYNSSHFFPQNKFILRSFGWSIDEIGYTNFGSCHKSIRRLWKFPKTLLRLSLEYIAFSSSELKFVG